MNTTGGRFEIDINGVIYSGRGKATLSTSSVTRENGANSDGTGYSTVKAKLVSLDLTFDRGVGLLWDEAMMLRTLTVTFRETDARVTHYFNNANWSGEPMLDTETGEVSGLKIECPGRSYRQQRRT